jgi:hypothetical protein
MYRNSKICGKYFKIKLKLVKKHLKPLWREL